MRADLIIQRVDNDYIAVYFTRTENHLHIPYHVFNFSDRQCYIARLALFRGSKDNWPFRSPNLKLTSKQRFYLAHFGDISTFKVVLNADIKCIKEIYRTYNYVNRVWCSAFTCAL